MKILGIDPGYDRLGLAIIEKLSRGKEVLVFSECFQTSNKDPIQMRLFQIGQEVARVIDKYKPECAAIENLFIAVNQKTAMRVSESRGIILYELFRQSLPVSEYTPLQIKSAITGDGRSDKTRIMKMIEILITIPKNHERANKILDDEYDAIAVALTHSACMKQK